MTATEAEIAAFVRASGRDWKNYCQALVYQICKRFGVARRVYSSATAAYLDSKIVSRDARQAPPSAVHFWSFWATIDGVYANYGHTGVDTRGGGVGVMSTGRPTQIGDGAAIIDFVEWTRGMGRAVKYLGWSLSNGQNAVTIVPSGSAAGGGGTPPPPPLIVPEEDDMPINFRSTTGGVSYSMVPGICITRHENEIAAALTLEFVTGKKYPGAGATPAQREEMGERQLRDEEILVMLAKFGFWSASGSVNNLPDVGKTLWSDALKDVMADADEARYRIRGTLPENAGQDMLQIIWDAVKDGIPAGGAAPTAAQIVDELLSRLVPKNTDQ